MACSSIFVQLMYSRKLTTKVELDAATSLTQKKGKKSPDNYQGISLIHPLGRLFSKVVTNWPEADNHTMRAACQSGFHYSYRVKNNHLIL